MKILFRTLVICFTIFAFLSCNKHPDSYYLTKSESEYRASLLSNINYYLNINLTKEDSFTGDLELTFDTWKSDSLRLDYFQGEILALSVNDRILNSALIYKNGFLFFPSENIQKGKNKIKVSFKTQYARTGNGLHKFLDPDDKEIYIYSQFEAFHANKMFPCFDQPDLKANYQLTVDAPKNWKVISSNLPSSVITSKSKSENLTHLFPRTEKFSTYVFSLHAGPFDSWRDTYKSIPLNLYVRKSLAKYVDSKNWFEYTKSGLAFYETYFDFPYPFSKYDQLIVPEFNFGAMENVGAVTFSERFVSRSPMTRAQKENLSDVILHEMAHMWFGNLVTMRWWNGLWLNESFATYMASLAQERSSEFSETWETFFERMKQWAYDEDSFSTNHAIETKIKNTEEAFTQFDGITYGKGASVLKQLVFFIGEASFQKGVQNYLKRYAYSNSTLKDFLFELELAGGVPLRKWSKDWLETKGTNEIEFISECSDGFLKWKIQQSAPGLENKLRDHKTIVGLYSLPKNYLEPQNLSPAYEFESFPLVYSGRSTSYVQEVKHCPDFILVNLDDQDFVVWKWKNINIRKMEYILSHDTDSFRKLILWTSIYRQIELGNISFDEFQLLTKQILPRESNLKIKKWILEHLASDKGNTYFTSRFWFPLEKRNNDINILSETLWNGFLNSKTFSDEQRYWFSAYLNSTFLPHDQERLWNIYLGKINTNGMRLDQDQKWSILIKLSSIGFNSDILEIAVANEKKSDPSSRGVNASFSVEATKPDIQTKMKWMNNLIHPEKKTYSSSTLRSVAYHLFPNHQKELQLPFLKSYLEALTSFNSYEDENYLDGFAKSLAPNFCTNESRLILTKFVNSHPKLRISIKKTILKQIDLEAKCMIIRKKSVTGLH